MCASPWPFADRIRPVVEVKYRPDGSSARFRCRLVARGPRTVVLLYVLREPRTVAGLRLCPGVATFAYYWTSRWYNVYHWILPDGTTLGHYVNVATPAQLARDQVEWTDLGADVLMLPGHHPQVLDEEDLDGLPPHLRTEARRSLRSVLNHWRRLAQATERRTRQLLARLSQPDPAPPG